MPSTSGRVLESLISGILVGSLAATVHSFIIPHDPEMTLNVVLGDLVAALAIASICIALHLRATRAGFVSLAVRIMIVSNLSRELCDAALPLCLATHRSGAEKAIGCANETIKRLCEALNDANTAAIRGRASS
jgi:hypothetical protein